MIADFTSLQIGAALVAALAAGFVRGLAGFGMALLLVPVLGLTVSPQSAVITVTILGLFIGTIGLRRILGQAESSAFPIGVFAVLATPLGLWLLRLTDPDLARLLIALVALGAFILVLLPKKAGTHPPGKVVTGLTGIASGVLTGFAGMPGPPVIPYYLRRAVTPQMARASMMAIFLATSIAGCSAAWLMGMMEPKHAMLAAILFLAIVTGNALGGLAFGKVSPALWRIFVGLVLGAAAVGALLKLV